MAFFAASYKHWRMGFRLQKNMKRIKKGRDTSIRSSPINPRKFIVARFSRSFPSTDTYFPIFLQQFLFSSPVSNSVYSRWNHVPVDINGMQGGMIWRCVRHQRLWLPFRYQFVLFLKFPELIILLSSSSSSSETPNKPFPKARVVQKDDSFSSEATKRSITTAILLISNDKEAPMNVKK